MKRVNPTTLQLEEVKEIIVDTKDYVYVLTEDIAYNEYSNFNIFSFKNKQDALKKTKELITKGKDKLKKYCIDMDDLEEETFILDEEEGYAEYISYELENELNLHCNINLRKVEVM